MLSAQRRQFQLGGEFHVLLSVLVYLRVQRRGAVQIAHTLILSDDMLVSLLLLRFMIFAFFYLIRALNR